MARKEKIEKWIDLSKLPREKGFGANGNKFLINWTMSKFYKVKFKYDDIEGEVEIIDYDGKNVTIKYNNKTLKIYTGSFRKCQLGKLLNRVTNEFKIEIGTRFKDNKRDITIIDRKYIKDKKGCKRKHYKYRCNVCGFECNGEIYKTGENIEDYSIVENDLLHNHGCACCIKSSQIVVPNINSIVAKEETHWMIPYFQGGYDEAKMYNPQSNQKIIPICPECGTVKDKSINISNLYKNHSIGCMCGDGIKYPEKFMYSVLKQLNIEFVTQYSPKWIKNKFYDFYIPSLNCIIETHGEQHYKESSGVFKDVKYQKANDKYKKKIALDNGINDNHYIVIDCRISDMDFIKKNILNSRINNLYDLSNIDYCIANEYAWTSNLKKDICEYWNYNNGNKNTIELSKVFHLSSNTIVNYLKTGNELGWCIPLYSPKEEMRKAQIKNGKSKGKPIEIFKNDISLGIFKSATELSRQSEELFGVKLMNGGISEVAKGSKVSYKGFTFKYTDKENIITINKNSKSVEIFKDSISLGIFLSVSELQRQSFELFGTLLSNSAMYEVANGKRPHHKGFTFRYIPKETKDTIDSQPQPQSA